MLSVTDLLSLTTKPKEKDISLQVIQKFYKEHLCDRLFIFELDDPQRSIIKLRFKEANLSHLLGIHYILKPTKKGASYAGQNGYNLLENGTVTFELLKTTNKQWFKSKKNRMLYFPFVYQVLQNPTAIIFSSSHLTTQLDLDIILYNHLDNTYLHLGLDKDSDSDFYYPKSFYDRKKDDHIAGQTKLTIKSKKIELD
ncbi:TPA: hypothetical protein QCX53_005139 [Bacillus cereus]|nr:hypothetical protein [Bacillus cereus]